MMTHQNSGSLLPTVGLGVVAGAALGLALAPKKQHKKSPAGKALKAVGEVVENFSEAIHMD